jgi:hypothetical protein
VKVSCRAILRSGSSGKVSGDDGVRLRSCIHVHTAGALKHPPWLVCSTKGTPGSQYAVKPDNTIGLPSCHCRHTSSQAQPDRSVRPALHPGQALVMNSSSPRQPFLARKHDDSQGKLRASDTHKRMALLLLAFVLGVTFGVVISQRLYVEANRPEGSTQLALKQAPVVTHVRPS